MTDAQQLPTLARYARVAAREVSYAVQPLQELVLEWAEEAKTFLDDNPRRFQYVSAWAQRCATFAIQVATQ